VAQADQEIGFRGPQNRLERLQRLAASLGRMEGGSAAREDDPTAGQPPIGRHAP
jgi:hypothetical protein